jgi:hypothetical protein
MIWLFTFHTRILFIFMISFAGCKICTDILNPLSSKDCSVDSSTWANCCLISSNNGKKCKKFDSVYLKDNIDWHDKFNITWQISCDKKIEKNYEDCYNSKSVVSSPTFSDCAKLSLSNNTCCNAAFTRGQHNFSSCIFYGEKTSYFKNSQLGMTIECSSQKLHFFILTLSFLLLLD